MIVLLIVVGVIVGLVVWYLICSEFQSIAEDKGYPEQKYLWLPFFFSIVGMMLVIALPDRGTPNVVLPPEFIPSKEKEPIAVSDELPDL